MSRRHDEDCDGDWEEGTHCEGEGHYHDCGDDCCPCLHPEVDERVRCWECAGQGGWIVGCDCPVEQPGDDAEPAHG